MRRCKEEIISQQDIIESKKSRGRQSVPAQSQASAGCAAAQYVRSPGLGPEGIFRECPDTHIACRELDCYVPFKRAKFYSAIDFA